jgi:hypothetical protein
MRFDRILHETLSAGSTKQMPTATHVRWRRAARYTPGDRTIGGTLSATTSHLVHKPDRWNLPADRSVTELPFDQITGISVQERSYERSDSEMRRRLRIDCRNGDAYLFVLENPGSAALALQQLAAGDPTPDREPSAATYDAWVGLSRDRTR